MQAELNTINVLYITGDASDKVDFPNLLEGYSSIEITTVGSLIDGRNLLFNVEFDTIVLNFNLKDSDQIIDLEKLSQDYPKIPLIFLCDSNDAKVIAEALAKGADSCILNSKLTPTNFFNVINDSLERYRLYQKLNLDEVELLKILAAKRSGIFKVSLQEQDQFRLISVNHAFCNLFGKSHGEIESKLIDDVFPEKTAVVFKQKIQEAIAFKRSILWEANLDFGIKPIYTLVKISPHLDSNGISPFVVGSIQNLTSSNKVKSKFNRGNAFLKSVFENSLNAILILDDSGKYLAINKDVEDLFECGRNELLQMNIADTISMDADNIRTVYARYLKYGFDEGEIQFFTKNGQAKVVIYSAKRIGEDFNIVAMMDITDRIEFHRAINKLSMIAQNNMDGVIITDTSGAVTWMNESMTRICGYSLYEMLGKKPGELLQGPLSDPAIIKQMSDAKKGAMPFDVEIANYHKDGHTYYVQIQGQPLFDNQKNHIGFFAMQTDISNKVEYQKRLTESNQRLELALSIGRIGIIEWNFSTDKLEIFGFTTAILDLDPKQETLEISKFLDNIEPSDREDIQYLFEKARENKLDIPTKYFRLKNSQKTGIQWCEISGTIHKVNAGEARLIATLIDVTKKVELSVEISKASISTEEKVRHEISAEIHDGLQQTLISGLFNLGAVKLDMEALPKPLQEKINFAYAKIDQALYESRLIAHQLVPKVLKDFGLVDATEALLAEYNDSYKIDFYENLKVERLKMEVELNFFRIIQEAMNNILKHSKAEKVFIQIIQSNDKIVLNIEDDGVGFEKKGTNDGFGILSMKNRVNALNGTIEIDSQKNMGTHIFIEIPNK